MDLLVLLEEVAVVLLLAVFLDPEIVFLISSSLLGWALYELYDLKLLQLFLMQLVQHVIMASYVLFLLLLLLTVRLDVLHCPMTSTTTKLRSFIRLSLFL